MGSAEIHVHYLAAFHPAGSQDGATEWVHVQNGGLLRPTSYLLLAFNPAGRQERAVLW